MIQWNSVTTIPVINYETALAELDMTRCPTPLHGVHAAPPDLGLLNLFQRK
jgi:hypothetical protein